MPAAAQKKSVPVTAINAIAKLHKTAHGRLTANDDEFRRAKVRSNQQTDLNSELRTGNGRTLVKVDPDLPSPRDTAAIFDKARLIPVGRLRLRPVGRLRSKKKLRESLEYDPPVKEVWFTGTYVPFSAHHAEAVRQTMKKYPDAKPFIGITGKQRPPGFSLPSVPRSSESLDDYLGHVKIAFNSYLKTNTPIELKMAVAKAAHPDLAPHMVWVKDAFGGSVDGSHDGPAPGAVIHSDTLYNQPISSSRDAFTLHHGDTARLHHGTQMYVKQPHMITDEEGDKINTTPLRLTLLTMHANGNHPDHQLNNLHSKLLGVSMDHPGVQQSRRMFDWMARGWKEVEKVAKVQYNQSRPVNDNQITEDYRHAAGVGERLLRRQSLQSIGKRIGTKPSPPTNESVLMKRAKRAARYDLRKKLAPNYHNLSTGQKQDIDERIAKHAEFKKLIDSHYKEYKKKYAERANASSHNKKLKE